MLLYKQCPSVIIDTRNQTSYSGSDITMPLPAQKVLFISYSHAYDEWSLHLYRAIFDTKLYFPFRDDRIPKTANWWHSLCLNIETSVAVVTMLTPEYLKSSYCMGELEYALELEKPILPIMVNLEARDYPEMLAKRNIQFVQADLHWTEQTMRENILSAMAQISMDYANGLYPSSLNNFLERSADSRPPVPHPVASNESDEDREIEQHIETIEAQTGIPADHPPRPQINITEIIKQFYRLKSSDPFEAGNILTQISQHNDIPFYFELDYERDELRAILEKHVIAEQEAQEFARLQNEYEQLQIVIDHQPFDCARRIVEKWLNAHPNFPDSKNYHDHFSPLKVAYHKARIFTGTRNRDWQPIIMPLGDIIPDTPIPDMEMCLVPVGKFMMGATDEQAKYDDEKPAHEQRITQPYWIARYPVTNAQYRQAVEQGGLEKPSDTEWYDDPARQDAPVIYVNWFQSRQFAEWAKCALPSELLWEYASRGVESWMYPWGNEFDGKKLVYNGNRQGKYPHPVTLHPEGASWVGAMHLSGNVWEWTTSELKDYPYVADDGREADTGKRTGVARWLVHPQYPPFALCLPLQPQPSLPFQLLRVSCCLLFHSLVFEH